MTDGEIIVAETVVLAESDHADLIRSIQGNGGLSSNIIQTVGSNDDHRDLQKPHVKESRRKKSGVWTLFTKIDRDYATCNLCDVKFSYRTSTSNLKKHLHKRHSVLPPASSAPRSKENETPDDGSDKNSPPIEKFHIKRERESPPRRIYLDDCMLTPKSKSSSQKQMRDEFDAFGVTIAAKLRKMDDRQRLYCEKIINEALFKGAFEQLCPTSELVVYLTSPQMQPEEGHVTSDHISNIADSSMVISHTNQGESQVYSN